MQVYNPESNYHPSTIQANPYLIRQSSSTPCASFPVIPPPAQKVLETVCYNCQLRDTPQNQQDYIQLLAEVQNNKDLKERNIANILRTMADSFNKDRKLQNLMLGELGFCPSRRIFKNSAVDTQSESQYQNEKEYLNNNDIGVVNLFDFLVSFGKTLTIIPDNQQKLDEMIKNTKTSFLLQNSHEVKRVHTFKRDPLLSAMCSQDDDEYISQNSQMLHNLHQSMIKTGADKLIDGTQQININAYNQSSYIGLEAHESLDLYQHSISPLPLRKPTPHQGTKLNEVYNFNFLHSNGNSNKQGSPSEEKKQCSDINQIGTNPQFSFMNILRSQDKKLQRVSDPLCFEEGFKKVRESNISTNNSLLNTPLIQNSKIGSFLTEQKQTHAHRQLMFNHKSTFESPYKTEGIINCRTQANTDMTKMQNQIGFSSPLGKRLGQQMHDMELPHSSFQTPPYKRLKIDDSHSIAIQQQQQNSDRSDSDEEDGNNGNGEDPNNSASRKKRGLKILSVKVQELVQKRQKTTYKDVANELIEQLKKNSEMQELTGLTDELSEREEEEEDSSIDNKSPSKRVKVGGSDKKSQLQKWEKNVRRRVYDALNVLYAAGVLKKDGKHVFCDNKAILLTKKIKDHTTVQKDHQQHRQANPQDGRLLQNLDTLKAQVEKMKDKVEEKREMLADQVKHYLSYKHLIQRNQELENQNGFNKSRILSLPFIIVSTKDSPDNEVDITQGEKKTILNIAVKMPFKCFGDADTLMQLGMYKVDSQFYHTVVPESAQILKCLSQFERELKAKLQQKSTAHSSEENTLLKAFKYFDLDNNGTCEPDEFSKALEKLGVVIPSKKDLDNLFKYYDTDSSGALDYKEFSAVITGNDQSQSKPDRQNAAYGQGLGSRQQVSTVGAGNCNEILEKVKVKLASRGARGIIGMGKQFKIFDDDNSRSLDQQEFKKAMKEQMLQLSDSDIITLFNAFDRNRDGTVDYDEFVRILRGPMSNFRKKLVQQAFNKIDKDGSGEVDISDIKGVYNASRHPDVIQGKKTEEDILYEFLQTFEQHHNIMNSTAPDHIVTREEFEEYYNNISSSIDNDQYFELMINNAWKLNEANKQYQKGWTGEAPGGKSAAQNAPSRPQGQTQERFQTASGSYGNNPAKKGESTYSKGSTQQGTEAALAKLRQRLASRGARGFIGMQRQFKIMDDNNSGSIDNQEFRKAIKDFRIDLNEQESRDVFQHFDRDSSGAIDYDEFVRGVRGPMNSFRQNIVKAAFKKLDKDGSGVIDINDIKGVYSAKTHPEVKSGKKTEDEILGEFLETFEQHHALNGGGVKDRSVTMDEFMEYYNNVSASVDNDQYFELMMINSWKLHGEASRKPAWTNVQKDQNIYKEGHSVAKSAPFGVDSQPTDYSTNTRPNQQQQQVYPSAGSSSWNVQQEGNISGSTKAKNPQSDISYSEKQLLEVFSSKLASRGARGIIGLQKQFKIADDDRSHDLDQYEFKKAIKDFRVPIQEKDIDRLFNIFDRDRSGRIDYDEFLRGVRGEMNNFRRNLSEKAFKIMDKDKSGVLNIDDIKGVYNGKMHPDVKAGKKTEEEVLGEFLDTFETHYALSHENSRDGQITLDEWMEYYNNVSMSIDEDKYFEAMMNSAWNLDGSRVAKKGWGGEF